MLKIFLSIVFIITITVSCGDSNDNGHDHDFEECGGHGHMHNGECHCDEGYKVDPDDNTQCIKDEEEKAWECEDGKDGWERCTDNKVQYCHIVEGMEPHFHWGQDCQKDGYECVEVKDGEAVCVDHSTSCSEGDFHCDGLDDTAYNCVDGHYSVIPCGTSKACHETTTEAVCEEKH